jgi:phospholipase C
VKRTPSDASNPDPTNPSGAPILRFHQTRYCESADLDHSWNGTHRSWNHGAMDGFTAVNVDGSDPTGSRTMGYYDTADLPFYYALYSTFAMGDRYFSSVLSQTFPNRFFLLAGTSFGHIANDFPTDDPVNDFAQRTIFNLLDEAGITWRIYYGQIAFGDEFAYVRNHVPTNNFPVQQYWTTPRPERCRRSVRRFSAQANVETDRHPPEHPGGRAVRGGGHALLASPQARVGAVSHLRRVGGFYDHVPLRRRRARRHPADAGTGDGGGVNNRDRVPAVVVALCARLCRTALITRRSCVSSTRFDPAALTH